MYLKYSKRERERERERERDRERDMHTHSGHEQVLFSKYGTINAVQDKGTLTHTHARTHAHTHLEHMLHTAHLTVERTAYHSVVLSGPRSPAKQETPHEIP